VRNALRFLNNDAERFKIYPNRHIFALNIRNRFHRYLPPNFERMFTALLKS
jgi:hypothetical protein